MFFQKQEKEIFRKVSLDRLSSPEQLDTMMRVTTPFGWVALLTLGLILLVTVMWGFFGRITDKVAGQGIFLRSGGVLLVPALAAGRVAQLSAKVGDQIKAGQVVAIVEQPSLADKVNKARQDKEALVRERERVMAARRESDRMKMEVFGGNQANYEIQIRDLGDQIRLLEEQIPVDQQLLAKGLITKQTAINTKQKLAQLQADVSSVRAQIVRLTSERGDTNLQTTQQERDFDNKIDEYSRLQEIYQRELDLASQVESPYDGQVVEIKTSPGAIVNGGWPVLALEPQLDRVQAIVFVATENGKKVLAGMPAEVTPTTVKREEYGFMEGEVESVSDYPISSEALMRILGNEPLAKALGGDGPVTEVRLRLQEDKKTASGYRWSSSSGPPGAVSTGTICVSEIITRHDRPISLVIPYLREKLGI